MTAPTPPVPPASVDAFNEGRRLSRERLAEKLETRGKDEAAK